MVSSLKTYKIRVIGVIRGELFCSEAVALFAEEVLGAVAAVVNDNLLENDAGGQGTQGEFVVVTGGDGQFHHVLHGAACHRGVIDGMDVLRSLVQAGVEVDAL